MALECELLESCGFFNKYQPTEEMACRWFIQEYCRGPRMVKCRRMAYRLQHGTSPPDDMLPSGRMIAPKQNGDNLPEKGDIPGAIATIHSADTP